MKRPPFFPLRSRSPPAPGQLSGLLEAARCGHLSETKPPPWEEQQQMGHGQRKVSPQQCCKSCGFVKCQYRLFSKDLLHCLLRLPNQSAVCLT